MVPRTRSDHRSPSLVDAQTGNQASEKFVEFLMRDIGIEANFAYINDSIVHSIPGNQQNNAFQVTS